MAKIALIFLVAFCLVQFSLAGRVVREADSNEDKGKEALKAAEEALDKIKQAFADTFTKENVEKAVDQLQKLGEQISKSSKDVIETIQKKVSETADSKPSA